ncbi:MAG: hypothetical protein ACRD96_17105 [Bryobacteraceae bacterium]
MLAVLSRESFCHVLNTLGRMGYDQWRSRIGKGSTIIPDPFDKEQQLEVITMWKDTPGQTIRVCVFAIREMEIADLAAQFRPARPKYREDFYIFRDGRIDPPPGPPKSIPWRPYGKRK